MRIRTIKPEFWRSDDITSLSREHRLLFIGLWSYVDDNGVGVDDYRQISADLFALEADQEEVRDFVREGLAILANALLVVRYRVDRKSYVYISTWDRHQRVDRPGKPRYPRPPGEAEPPTSGNADEVDSSRSSSRGSRDTALTGTGEQGNRGTGEQGSESARRRATRIPEGFTVTPDMKSWASDHCTDVNVSAETAKFVDYWSAKAGRDATKVDWIATWRNWIRRAQEDRPRRVVNGAHRRPTADDKIAALQRLKSQPRLSLPGGD